MSIDRPSTRPSATCQLRLRCGPRRRPWRRRRPSRRCPIAKGIWFLRGAGNSVLFEFDDHLTLFEVYASEANAKAVIEKARSLVPGKPLTEAIVSHHHFDHTGGLRAAVSEGLTIVMQRGNEGLVREVTSRPAKLFPDALGRAPKPLKFRAVDDHLKMSDTSMEIDIYRVVANSHMADGLLVHVPRERLLVQGDLFDVSWEIYWWGSSYMDNVKFRNLQVDRDLPVHGRVLPIAEVQAAIAKQIATAQALCASVDAAGLSMRGCPVKTTLIADFGALDVGAAFRRPALRRLLPTVLLEPRGDLLARPRVVVVQVHDHRRKQQALLAPLDGTGPDCAFETVEERGQVLRRPFAVHVSREAVHPLVGRAQRTGCAAPDEVVTERLLRPARRPGANG